MECVTCGTSITEPSQHFCHVCGSELPTRAHVSPLTWVTGTRSNEEALTTLDRHPLPKAVLSLVMGILGWTVLPIVGAILAVVFGHQARRAFREQPHRYRGKGLVNAGLILGYAELGIILLILGGLILRVVG